MADLPERKNLRLRDYDYSQNGAYFITICTKNKRCSFGVIEEEKLEPTASARIVESVWKNLPQRYSFVDLDSFIVMPNHFHGILSLTDGNNTLGRIIRTFKAVSTQEIRRTVDTSFFWQRNYYEHIIRSEEELARVRDYIVQNPLKWELDRENPQAKDHKPAEEWMV